MFSATLPLKDTGGETGGFLQIDAATGGGLTFTALAPAPIGNATLTRDQVLAFLAVAGTAEVPTAPPAEPDLGEVPPAAP